MNTHLSVPQSLLHGDPSLEALHREAYYAVKSEQAAQSAKPVAPAADHSTAHRAALIRAKATTAAGGFFA